MGKNDFLKIAIAAIIAVIFKEFLTWTVAKSKPPAKTAAKISGKWIWEHVHAIEFATDIGTAVLFTELFFIYPIDGSQVTYYGVRLQILVAILIIMQLLSAKGSFKRWKNQSKSN